MPPWPTPTPKIFGAQNWAKVPYRVETLTSDRCLALLVGGTIGIGKQFFCLGKVQTEYLCQQLPDLDLSVGRPRLDDIACPPANIM